MFRVNSETKLFGILGSGIGYTLSPYIHNFVFRLTEFNAVYLVFDVSRDKFDDVVKGLLVLAKGFNVTTPYKELVVPYLRELSPAVEKTGAVNTVYEGVGYNTDYEALKQLVKASLNDLYGMKCLVVGAGGAARASILALAELGCSVKVFNRTKSRAKELAFEMRSRSVDVEAEDECKSVYDVILNATPQPEFALRHGCKASSLVVDLVYRPVITKLIENALKEGIKVITGLEVLIRQALLAQSIWQNKDITYLESEVNRYLCQEILSGECLK
ncbi:MAG: shikimate dehydrogenase [Acidilobaceae archaeon]